jgi:protoporphyrinogen oxidase
MEHHDTVVIGGGIAGLAAANCLGTKTLVLESRNRAGGRVHTMLLAGQPCELGTTIGYDPAKFPIPVLPSPFIYEEGRIGLLGRREIFEGENPAKCVIDYFFAREGGKNVLEALLTEPSMAFTANLQRRWGDDEFFLLESLFSVLHPASLGAYASKIWEDAFHRFHPSHHERGNQELPAQLSKNVNLRLGVTVSRVVEDKNGFNLTIQDNVIRTGRLVIATDAYAASDLMRNLDHRIAARAERVRYGSFVVCGVATEDDFSQGRSYVITPFHSTSAILYRRTKNPRLFHTIAFFAGKKADCFFDQTDAEVIKTVISIARVINCRFDRVLDAKIARWARAGTIISDYLLRQSRRGWEVSDRRIALAGDYTMKPFYGVLAAGHSGIAAAKALNGVS